MRVFYVDPISTPTARINVQGILRAYNRVSTVKLFDYRAHVPRKGRNRPAAVRAMNAALVREAVAFKPDIVHLGKCETVYASSVQKIKRATKAFIVHCFGDWRKTTLPFVYRIGAQVDLSVFSNADPKMNAAYQRMGCKNIDFWCAGTDQGIFKPYKLPKRFDVVFMVNMGKMTRSREALQGPRNQFILRLAKAGVNVHLFGRNDGIQAQMHPRIYAHDYVSGVNFAKVCSQAKIALGFGVAGILNYTSWPRLVNSMASGTLYLTRYFKGLETFFENREHLVWFTTMNEAVKLAKYYLDHDDERNAIAAAGRQKVLMNHTWDARIAQIVKWSEGR